MPFQLHGKKILITREEKQAKLFSHKVRKLGGIPIEVPLLQILCKGGREEMELLQRNEQFSWLFFTSVNGVHCFFTLLNHYGAATEEILAGSKFAAVGHKTARELEKHGFQADFIPSVYSAETMTKEFTLPNTYTDKPILLIRGNRSRNILPDWFKEQGIPFRQMEVYETGFNFAMKDELNRQLQQNKPDIITFTSPSSVEAFMKMKETQDKTDALIACIGTTTEERAMDFGLRNLLIPDEFTIDGMLDKMGSYIEQKGEIDDE
ncbi:uroporphyrinogen-III synthase [Lentibacillus cibarius]|uniref:Uroporphyrinogen-III synthase n=1 Tax=Lentibacillus cibarius TaxID=2583219 RepID=A0A549YLS9_9BACI|nr:uroporphyrinogen-III synthase [Lentibacillus cibarius]TRM12845.1 uroporphyrinogen-III synthase [Lentibacillus cibarius]